MLDIKTLDLSAQIKTSSDPDTDGLCDMGEYFIGIGFVAIQQYLVETIMFTGLDKATAFDLGPIHESEDTCVAVMNSCANWWKHEPEWWDKGNVPKNGERTFDQVTSISKTTEYGLSQVLASFCKTEELNFHSVIPYLEEWREAVHINRINKAEPVN